MARASSRLDLFLLPPQPEQLGAADILARWAAQGVDQPVVGGCGRVRVMDEPSVRFLSCGQGGFRVSCPQSGANIVAAFVKALGAWRSGGARALSCDCGAVHDLDALRFVPDAGFARSYLWLEDVGSDVLLPAAEAALLVVWGGFRMIRHRG